MRKNTLSIKNYLELNGELIYLEKLDGEHIDEYWASISKTCVEANFLTTTSQIFSKSNVASFLENIVTDKNRIDFIIREKESNKIVGEIVINDVDRQYRSASIRAAIYKREDFGNGYGSEALILALNYGFGMMNLHRVELEVLTINKRAIHVYERIGFKREGVKRDGCYYNHQYYDLVTMSILEDEFRKKFANSGDIAEEDLCL